MDLACYGLGAALVVSGFVWIWPPLGLIVAGFLLIAAAVRYMRAGGGEE